MDFKAGKIEKSFWYLLGNQIGFLLGLFLFASILYLILSNLEKIPFNITYVHVIELVIILFLIRQIIRKVKNR